MAYAGKEQSMKKNGIDMSNTTDNEKIFIEVFQKYGYVVESFGKSFIADNGIFCIPFTVIPRNYPVISTISFSSQDKENIEKYYADCDYIGCKIFNDWMNNDLHFTPIGRLCNHDHGIHEVEMALNF